MVPERTVTPDELMVRVSPAEPVILPENRPVSRLPSVWIVPPPPVSVMGLGMVIPGVTRNVPPDERVIGAVEVPSAAGCVTARMPPATMVPPV